MEVNTSNLVSITEKYTHPDTILKLHSAYLEWLEELRDGLPIRLRVDSRPCRRDLRRREVRDTRSWYIHALLCTLSHGGLREGYLCTVA